MFKYLVAPLFIALLFITFPSSAQISLGGQPYSFSHEIEDFEVNQINIAKPDIQELKRQDRSDSKNGSLAKFGSLIPTDIDFFEAASLTELENGERLWTLSINSDDALALTMYYDQFELAEGAYLHLYNSDKSELIGSFSAHNNNALGNFASGILSGASTTLELRETIAAIGQSTIHIDKIGYAYRMYKSAAEAAAGSDPCQVDVNCAEGSQWQNEKEAVARILVVTNTGQGWCTGTVVNNTEQDCAPYFLTALHCGENISQSNLNQWMFYFDYEVTSCGGGTGGNPNVISGAMKVADSNDGGGNSGSDFMLLRFNNAIPDSYGVYYAGWNANNTSSGAGVCIHHPSGDVKKISTYNTNLLSSTWGSVPNTHWVANWVQTTNGWGVTEGGSSGSAIFNTNREIVGTLTGGASFCNDPTNPDLYGKTSYHWQSNGSGATTRLQPWLAPGSNATNLAGAFSPCSSQVPPIAAVTYNDQFVCAETPFTLIDNSTNNPSQWLWDFGGGQTSNQESVTVTVSTPGTYSVTQTVTNGAGTNSNTFNIIVTDCSSFSCNEEDNLNGGAPTLIPNPTGGGTGYVSGHNNFSDQAKAEYFDNNNNDFINGLFFEFGIANGNSDLEFVIWEANGPGGEPGSVKATRFMPISFIADDVNNGNRTWVDFGGPLSFTGPFYAGFRLNYNDGSEIALKTNSNGDSPNIPPTSAWEQWQDDQWWPYHDGNINAETWELYVSHAIWSDGCNNPVGIETVELTNDFTIAPNPVADFVNLSFTENAENYTINLIDVSGQVLISKPIHNSQQISLDMSGFAKGMYFVKVTDLAGKVSTKKILKQ